MKALVVALLLLSGCSVAVTEAPPPEFCSGTWSICVVGDGQPGEPTISCESDGGHYYCTCDGHAFGKPVVAKCTIDLHPEGLDKEKAPTSG
jgi:hypothetical protein